MKSETTFRMEDHADELGPAKVVEVWDPDRGLRGIVAIDKERVFSSQGQAERVGDKMRKVRRGRRPARRAHVGY